MTHSAHLFWLISGLCCLLILPLKASAAETMADIQYAHMARQAVTYIPPDFNFHVFRSLYTDTSFYDPAGTEAQETLLTNAFSVQNSGTEELRATALTLYQGTLRQHLANMSVLVQAIALARTDARFGDIQTLERIKTGLMDAVLSTGNGETLNTAYRPITLLEETMVLARLGFQIDETVYRELHTILYHMHFGRFIRTQKESVLFVDISLPASHIRRSREEKPRALPDLDFKGQAAAP